MNETIGLTPRQKMIINLLAETDELSRQQITQKLLTVYPASKATLARDLKLLVGQKQIVAKGNGPNTVYQSAASHPLLKRADLNQYFQMEPDERKHAKTFFDFNIFNEFHNLIPAVEQEELKTIYRSFTKSAEKLDQTLVNQIAYPPEKALIIGSMLAYIQPFADGNKRTSRMFTNALLLAYDYFPLSYRSIDENEYKSALILFFETNNLYHVKRLFLEQYRFALRTYFIA